MRAVSKGISWRSPSLPSPALPFLCFYPLSISFLTLAQTLSSRGPSLAFSNQSSAIDAPQHLILLDQNLARLRDPDPQSAPAIVGQLREFYYAPGIKPDNTDFEEDKKRAFLQKLAFHIVPPPKINNCTSVREESRDVIPHGLSKALDCVYVIGERSIG